jgi:lipopolysaccharide transport system permease protein
VIADLKRLAKSKDLLYMLTWRDIRVRYKQSIMGFFWAILMPALIVSAGVLVRLITARYSGNSLTAQDLASVMVRAVTWAFFIAGIRFATSSLVGNPNLITKIAFPKEVFPISAVLANLLDLAVALVLVLVVISIMGTPPGLHGLWFLPLLLVLIAFTIGFSMVLAALNLFFRDVKYIVEVLLTYAIFFTPVLYEASALGKWQHVIMLNPVAPILEALSDTLVSGRNPDPAWMLYSVAVSVVFLAGGYWLFKQLEVRFAESI